MSKGTYVPLGMAQDLGHRLIDSLKPYCVEIRLVGSVRRTRPLVHDLEVAALVKEIEMNELFGGRVAIDRTRLDDALGNMADSHMLNWRVKKGGKKYKQLQHQHTGLMCDVFIVTDERAWGSTLVVRTGPRPFSIHVMKQARDLNMFFSDGFLLHDHFPQSIKGTKGYCPDHESCPKIIPLRRESDVFETLKIRYLTPEAREKRYGVG